MSWTWTGYDYDAVHRFKDEAFFQTGRNSAEARFWKLKIHEEDRRGTKSSIAFDKDAGKYDLSDHEEGTRCDLKEREKSLSPNLEDYQYSHNYAPPARDNSKDYQYSYAPSQMDYSTDYHYSYPNPRDRSMSIVSTTSSRMKQFTASKDYQYSYPEELEEEDEQEQKNEDLQEKIKEDSIYKTTENAEAKNEEQKEDVLMKKKEAKDSVKKGVNNMKTIRENRLQLSEDHISSRFY